MFEDGLNMFGPSMGTVMEGICMNRCEYVRAMLESWSPLRGFHSFIHVGHGKLPRNSWQVWLLH